MLRDENEPSGADSNEPAGDTQPVPEKAEQKFLISTFQNKRDTHPLLRTITWNVLLKGIANPEIRSEKDGPAFSPACFDPAKRLKGNVREISMLVLDCDVGGDWPSDLQVLSDLGITRPRKIDSA
jgi:hypothetical protein